MTTGKRTARNIPFRRFRLLAITRLLFRPILHARVGQGRTSCRSLDEHGEPVFVKDHPPSEHGLGHFLNPTDPDSEDPRWIEALWRVIVLRGHGRRPELPSWIHRPTMVRTTVTSPPVLRAFRHINEGQPYSDRVKPFNFVLTAAGAKPPAGAPFGASFRLIGPYESDPRRWEGLSGSTFIIPETGTYSITTRDGRPGMARVDTFADVLAKYETHPEVEVTGVGW